MYLALEILSILCCYAYAQEKLLEAYLGRNFQSEQDHHVWFDKPTEEHQATEYFGQCSNDYECKWLGENRQCKYGHCQCQNNFRWYMGKCIAYSGLNERCTVDLDCYDGYTWDSLKCSENSCICNDGFQNRDNVDCRKISKAKGRCALNIDCPSGYSCQIGICKKLSSKNLLSFLEIQENTEPNRDLTTLVTNGYHEQACKTDADCKDKNAECYDGTKTCTCKRGYFLYNNTCEAELGVKTCNDDKDCYILQAECKGEDGKKQCRCRDYWFNSKDNRKCFKTMQESNWICLSDEWCYALGVDSYCSSTGTCKCSAIATLNETSMVCKKERDSTLCKSDEECNYLKPHSSCVDQKCVCDSEYQEKNGVCISALGGSCTSTTDCAAVEHAVCSNHKCTCDKEFVESQTDNTLCLKEAKIGEKCQEDIQCLKYNRRAGCSKSGVCDCTSAFKYINSTCEIVRSSQDYCTDARQCRLGNDNLICRNSKCQCPTKMKLIDNKCEYSSGMQIKPLGALVLLLIIKLLSLS